MDILEELPEEIQENFGRLPHCDQLIDWTYGRNTEQLAGVHSHAIDIKAMIRRVRKSLEEETRKAESQLEEIESGKVAEIRKLRGEIGQLAGVLEDIELVGELLQNYVYFTPTQGGKSGIDIDASGLFDQVSYEDFQDIVGQLKELNLFEHVVSALNALAGETLTILVSREPDGVHVLDVKSVNLLKGTAMCSDRRTQGEVDRPIALSGGSDSMVIILGLAPDSNLRPFGTLLLVDEILDIDGEARKILADLLREKGSILFSLFARPSQEGEDATFEVLPV